MKRYGIQATREALKNGAFIRAWDFYTLNAGYKITTEGGEILGFITCDLFSKLLKNSEIVKVSSAYSFTDYAAPVIINIEEIDDESDETPEPPTMDTPDTIQPKENYKIMIRNGARGTARRVLVDGSRVVMDCEKVPFSEMVENMRDNECFELCEIFSTKKSKWAYWRDNEINEDYISKIGLYLNDNILSQIRTFKNNGVSLVDIINFLFTCDYNAFNVFEILTLNFNYDADELAATFREHFNINYIEILNNFE